MIKPASAERYPVQILSHPTIRHWANVDALAHADKNLSNQNKPQ